MSCEKVLPDSPTTWIQTTTQLSVLAHQLVPLIQCSRRHTGNCRNTCSKCLLIRVNNRPFQRMSIWVLVAGRIDSTRGRAIGFTPT